MTEPTSQGGALSPADRAVAEWQIARMIYEFVLLNDSGDYDRIGDMLTEDAVFTRPSAPNDYIRGRDTIIAQYKSRPARFTRHLVHNVVVTIESANRASAVSYLSLLVSSAKPEEGKPRLADPVQYIGGYQDKLVRDTGGPWRFSERLGNMAMVVKGPAVP